jgi:hypothetical protein
MRNFYVRRPFVRWTSRIMMGYMDRHREEHQFAEFDDEPERATKAWEEKFKVGIRRIVR